VVQLWCCCLILCASPAALERRSVTSLTHIPVCSCFINLSRQVLCLAARVRCSSYRSKCIVQQNHSNMEQGLSWDAASRSPTQQITHLLWNQKAHYRVHKIPSLDPIGSQFNPVHTLLLLKSILRLFSPLHLGLPSGHVHSGFSTKSVCAFLMMFRPSHPSWFYHPCKLGWRV
jgi:hypothetical protein